MNLTTPFAPSVVKHPSVDRTSAVFFVTIRSHRYSGQNATPLSGRCVPAPSITTSRQQHHPTSSRGQVVERDLETPKDIVTAHRRCRNMEPEAPHEIRGAVDGSGFIVTRSTPQCLFGSSPRPARSDISLDMAASSYRGSSLMDRRVLP